MRRRIALSVMPLETRREAIIGLATEGDHLGYDGFFLPETWAYDTTVLLAEAAAPGVPIPVAGLGDAMARLAGGVGGGWAAFLYPLSKVPNGGARVREGGGRGCHSGRLPEIHPSLPVVVADSEAKAREGAAWFVSFYVTTMGTIYRDSLTRQGYGKGVEAVLAANAPKFTGVIPADAEELLEQLIVYGTPPEARRRLGRWHEAGADSPVLLLRPNLAPEERALTLEAFRPMLQAI